MRITGFDLFPLRLNPVKVGYRSEDELSVVARADTIILRMNTDAGISGLGEAATIRSYFNQTSGTLLDWLAVYEQALVGADPRNILGVHQRMDRVSGAHAPGCHPARAAVDMACFDLIGKHHNCPVYEVLGGAYRTELELLTNLYEATAEEKAAACREYVGRGFRGLKVKIGDTMILNGFHEEHFRIEKAKLVAALEAVPEHIYIDADANQSWGNAKIAVRVFETILRERFYPNLSLEQPLHHLDLAGHQYLRSVLPIPIILDESVVSPEAAFQIARHDAADRIVLKINRVGGFHNARKIVNICEANSIGISFDTMPFTKLGDTALCHLAATVRDHYPVDAEGHLWFEDTPLRGGVTLDGGKAILSNAPGFGVELDEAALPSFS